MRHEPADPAVLLERFRRYLASFEQHDAAARRALFEPQAVIEDPVGAPPRQGAGELEALWNALPLDGAAVTATLKRFITGGREALAHYVLHVEPPHAAAISYDVYATVEFGPDLRIRRLRAFMDADSVLVRRRGSE